MLRILRFLVILLSAQSVFAREIVLKNGKSLKVDSDIIVCEDREPLKCKIDFDYVGKKYDVEAPNGKIQGRFEDKSEALAKARDLVAFSVCEQVVLNFEDNE